MHKKSIREHCQKYWDEKARKLEDVAQCSNLGEVFKMLWQAKAGPRSNNCLIKKLIWRISYNWSQIARQMGRILPATSELPTNPRQQ